MRELTNKHNGQLHELLERQRRDVQELTENQQKEMLQLIMGAKQATNKQESIVDDDDAWLKDPYDSVHSLPCLTCIYLYLRVYPLKEKLQVLPATTQKLLSPTLPDQPHCPDPTAKLTEIPTPELTAHATARLLNITTFPRTPNKRRNRR